MLAAVTAVWAASSSAYTLAVRAGSPILAVLPPVALVAFADVVLEDGVRPVYAATFLLAALAVVFTDGLRRIRQWGPVWSGTYRDHTLRSAAGRGVRRVTLVALGVALLVPGLLPGFRSDPLVDLSGSGGGIGDDPFASIHASLNREDAVEQFRVTTTNGAASYWRLLTLDHFDGSTWTMADPELGGAQTYPLPATLPAQIPESAEPLDQEITIEGYADRWVPMAYPAATVDFPADAMEYDEAIGTARVPDALHAGETYRVTSYRVLPTPRVLDPVTFEPASEYGDLTFLPDAIRDELDEIALDWTADAATPYREVLAIQQALKADPFEYDKTVEPEPGADAMLEFLTERQTGFCQQFATAMAALVRSRGYPARIGYGYKEGDNLRHIRGRLPTCTPGSSPVPGYGLAFDPTPGLSPSPLIQKGTYLDTAAAERTPLPDEPVTTGPTGPDPPIGPSGGLPPKIAGFERVSRTSTGGTVDLPPFVPRAGSRVPEEPGYSIPYGLLLTIVLVALGVLLVLVPIVKAAWRHRALHRRREPREAVLAAYRVFDGEAADLGLGRSSGETLVEHRDRIASTVRFSDGHLARLTGAAMRAAYAPESPDPDERRRRRAAHTAMDIARSTGLVRR
jgi:hypothetical protein